MLADKTLVCLLLGRFNFNYFIFQATKQFIKRGAPVSSKHIPTLSNRIEGCSSKRSVCLFVCLSVCLFVCLLACPSVRLSVCHLLLHHLQLSIQKFMIQLVLPIITCNQKTILQINISSSKKL